MDGDIRFHEKQGGGQRCPWSKKRQVVSCIVDIDHMRLINIIEGGGLRIHYAMQHNTQYTLHRSISIRGLTSAPPLQCTVGNIHQNHQNIHISDNHFGPHVSSRSPVKERSIMTIKAQCAILKTACLGLFRYFAFVEPYPINYAGGPRAGLHHHL